MMKKKFFMKKIWQLMFISAILMISATGSFAQKVTVSGTISENDQQVVPGATILEKGTTNGTVSDVDGKFTLDVAPDAVLRISFVGMLTQEIDVGNQRTFNITMQVDAVGIEEVIAVGYGTQKKVNLTGSVSAIEGEELAARPIKSVSDALQGLAPGLNIQESAGNPDAQNSINIRGYSGFGSYTTPLILVDGVEQDINTVNPNDIESISVLKDAASTAIYGSRAPFGVILITTKKGEKGKMQINLNSNFSFATIVDNYFEQANALQTVDVMNETYNNSFSPAWVGDDQRNRIIAYMNGEINTVSHIGPNGRYTYYNHGPNANTNWVDEIYKDWQFRQFHTLSLSGGTDKLDYYVSLGLTDNDGMYNNVYNDADFYKRYNNTINLNSQVTNWLKLGISSKYTREQTQRPGVGDQPVAHMIGRYWPFEPVYQDNGSINQMGAVALLQENGYYENLEDDLRVTGSIDITPAKGLLIHADYTWNKYGRTFFRHGRKWGYIDADDNFYYADAWQANRISYVDNRWNSDTYQQTRAYATYDYSLSENNFKVLLGFEQELKNNKEIRGYKRDLISELIPSISTAKGDYTILDDALGHWATRGYFARFSYNYQEKYLLEFNGRYNGSSRFAPDSRWGFFPSVSVGYNIARENYWEPLKEHVSLFKIRASWGESGDQTNVANYLYLPAMRYNAQISTLIDGSRLSSLNMPGIVSPDLTWIKPRTIDIGFDLAAFNNRLQVTYDWYQRTIYNQLGPAEELPEVLGTTPNQKNNAVSETRGFDLSITWADKLATIRGKALNYRIRGNLSDYIGYVVEYENTTGTRSGWTPGETFNNIYGYETKMIAQSVGDVTNNVSQHRIWSSYWYPGDVLYVDQDGNGMIDSGNGKWNNMGDLVKLGNRTPRYTYGINLGVNWNNIDLACFIEGVGKRDYWTSSETFWGVGTARWNSMITTRNYDQYWRPDRTDAYFARIYNGGENNKNRQVQSRFLQSTAYMRLKNVQVGYTLPRSLVSNVNIEKLRLYMSVENAAMIFNKATFNYDPITMWNSSGKSYPPQTNVSFGLNLTF
jgi:TonB-linked SusC/RagA family outer membrane protein